MTWMIIERHTGRFLERIYPSGFTLWSPTPDRAWLFDNERSATAVARHRLPIAADPVEVD